MPGMRKLCGEIKQEAKVITKIGLAAGEVWDYLEKNGKKAKLDDIVASFDGNRDLAMMSIGWLAREGHVVLEGECPSCTVRLVK